MHLQWLPHTREIIANIPGGFLGFLFVKGCETLWRKSRERRRRHRSWPYVLPPRVNR